LLVYTSIRVLNALLFDFVFRLRRGYEAPSLVRNIFTLVAFTVVFVLIFNKVYSEVNLGALFTTSAIFGVIIGLALQDTLGNFFAGISLHADRPFQVGDVIVVGPQRHTGVVEGITWRAVKIRTFQNHIVLVSNSMAAKESIEVCPRENLNARIVFFGTLYSDSPAKTIHVVREAIREADNVSQKITPIVRIRDLGESSVDWEVKYWLQDYAKYNDTDALVRQLIWYALRRANITFAFPTRTLHVERRPPNPKLPDRRKRSSRDCLPSISLLRFQSKRLRSWRPRLHAMCSLPAN
jgi:small-conductance mechanosensitive channel